MRFSTSSALLLSLSTGALAQRPSDTPICDYYTTALLTDNTAENQYKLLTLIVNTVVIGNYTMPNVGIAVPGILAKGTYNGTNVDLLGYFDGSMATSNRGGSSGVKINFLDDGGAKPLQESKPADGTTSNQYKLLTHLYQFFGPLLGCTKYGTQGYPDYTGFPSMAAVHKFMVLDENQLGYFITQVGLAAASFGVAAADVQAVGMALATAFGMRCAPPLTIVPAQGPQLQSICQAKTCPLAAMNATCAMDGSMGGMPAANATVTMTSPKPSTTAFEGEAGRMTGFGWSVGVGASVAILAALM